MADEKKTKVSLYIPESLERRLRSAVAALSGPPHFLGLSDVAEEALVATVERLEREHNKGEPFPAFEGRPKRGRPLGS